MMISFARAGPTRRTKRVVVATPSGTPSSTSGIQNWASLAAQRKSQASASPQPPPIAWPLSAASVTCSRFSSRVLARSKRRRNWLFRSPNARRRSSGDIFALRGASAAAAHGPSQRQHRGRVAVVGAAVAILRDGAPELRHGEHHDVGHPVAQVLGERGERAAEVTQAEGEPALLGALAHVGVPTLHVGERDL